MEITDITASTLREVPHRTQPPPHFGQVFTALQKPAAVESGNERQTSPQRDFLVGFTAPADQNNPRDWSTTKKIIITLNLGNMALLSGFAGAIDSAVVRKAASDLEVTETVESLATGLVRGL